MKEFMMIFRMADIQDFQLTPEQVQATEKKWADWIGGIAAQNKYVGGNRPGLEGKTVRAGNVITDGPYAEVKEIILGAMVVRADSMEEAVEMAQGCPVLVMGGNVEVRNILPDNR